jgi:hypothetical protein
VNILLWILQILLALHTFIGAVWKYSNTERTVASLQAIPHGLWMALIVLEILCSFGLVLPAFFSKPVRRIVPVGAACIVAEMLLFSAVHVVSGAHEYDHLAYWLAVAAVGSFVAYGRWVLRPL